MDGAHYTFGPMTRWIRSNYRHGRMEKQEEKGVVYLALYEPVDLAFGIFHVMASCPITD